MARNELPSHPDVQDEIDGLRLSVDASELHGSLCGLLCGGALPGRGDWLAKLAMEPGKAAPPDDGVLDRLYVNSVRQLDDPEFGFQLLLPADEAPVLQRGTALLDWCRGFLGGFGLAAGQRPPLSPEATEALEDLGRIAATELSGGDSETDEVALAEISEFVRIAALVLHGDCANRPEPGRSLH